MGNTFMTDGGRHDPYSQHNPHDSRENLFTHREEHNSRETPFSQQDSPSEDRKSHIEDAALEELRQLAENPMTVAEAELIWSTLPNIPAQHVVNSEEVVRLAGALGTLLKEVQAPCRMFSEEGEVPERERMQMDPFRQLAPELDLWEATNAELVRQVWNLV
jgi:hypothetical protein